MISERSLRTVTIYGSASDDPSIQALRLVHDLAEPQDVIFYWDIDHLPAAKSATWDETSQWSGGQIPVILVQIGASNGKAVIYGFDAEKIREAMK